MNSWAPWPALMPMGASPAASALAIAGNCRGCNGAPGSPASPAAPATPAASLAGLPLALRRRSRRRRPGTLLGALRAMPPGGWCPHGCSHWGPCSRYPLRLPSGGSLAPGAQAARAAPARPAAPLWSSRSSCERAGQVLFIVRSQTCAPGRVARCSGSPTAANFGASTRASERRTGS